MTTRTALYTGPTAAELACIPEALKARPQWVVWRGVDKVDEKTGEIKLSKEPYNARPVTKHGRATFTRKASSTNKKTWGTFAAGVAALPTALAAWEHEAPADYRGGGLGFVFSPDDPFCGIDLDTCRNPETGKLASWAATIIAQVDSYSETSPTDTGVHILAQGTLPPADRKKDRVEMYTEGRFFTITGQHLPGTPATVEARQAAITAVHAAHVARPTAPPPPRHPTLPLDLDDMAILVKAKAAQNGAKFADLWAGDTSRYDGDDSAADQALCCALAFWTRDPSQIDRLFRGSGLYRDKWERYDYRERTIAHALSKVTTTYDPVAYSAEQAALKGRNGRYTSPPTEPGPPGQTALSPEPALPLSDYTNALAFVRDHSQDVRYLEAWDKWLHWTGTHWCYDVQGPIMQKAKATIKGLLRRAADLDGDALDAWMRHIKTSFSAGKLKALIDLAQDEPGVAIRLGALNTHPWLLPCPNGTIDLQTGMIQDPHRDNFLTECLAIPYAPTATCPTWEAFLWTIMGGRPPLSDDADTLRGGELEAYTAAQTRARLFCDFLQRVLGQCLTGDVSEQDLYIFYGTGANGKSTLLDTIMALLGAYAMKGTAELLMTTRNDRHPTERADLYGKRLVATIETHEAGRLNETFIKEATGGDPIRARRMRKDFWQFLPSHTMILATNHKPEIRGTDYAIWRRIKLIPFTVTIPGLDHGVGHFRPLSITRQRHVLAYHSTAMSHASLCQVF